MKGKKMKKLDNKLKLTLILYLIMFVYAIFTTMIGTQLLILLEEFHVSLSSGGIFSVLVNSGCMAGILASALFLDKYDPRKLVTITYLVFGIFLIVIKGANTYLVFLLVLFCLGACMKFLDAAINACVTKVNREDSGFYMNLLHGCFGVGAFVGPVFTTFLIGQGVAWRDTYVILGVVVLLTLLLYIVINRRNEVVLPTIELVEEKTMREVLMNPRILCLMLILFFYCGHQMGINNWFSTYLQTDMGVSLEVANLSSSLFWIGLILGRFGSAVLTKRVTELSILKCETVVASVLLLGGILSRQIALTILGVIASGLFAGSVIPLVLTIGYSRFPNAIGKVSTAMFLCIAGGAVVVPWIMGMVSSDGGLFISMIVDAVSLILVMIFAAIILPNLMKKEMG